MDNNKKFACVTQQEREAIAEQFITQDCVLCGRQIDSQRQLQVPAPDTCRTCASTSGG